ncbi:hypothethical protein (plasmid) [Ralstonia solanacearum CMR15]|nr:hypothethical protein [Ralstonia solanacearum CMR15]
MLHSSGGRLLPGQSDVVRWAKAQALIADAKGRCCGVLNHGKRMNTLLGALGQCCQHFMLGHYLRS